MTENDSIAGLTIIEPTGKDMFSIFKAKRIIAAKKTRYQNVVLADLEFFGRALIIDDYIQSTVVDEYIYHECLVHPAMITHGKPERVLIIGGGEGATLREVLKYPTVKEAIMVDIDGEVVDFCRKYLEQMHQGSFNDPRAKVVIMDGKEYVKEAKNEEFNVVILDLTDPYSSEIAKELYSEEFYREIYRILKPDGIMVTQAGNSFFYWETYKWVLDNVKNVFPIVAEYQVWIPSFGYAVNYIIGSKKHDPRKISEKTVDKILSKYNIKTRYYCGNVHKALMLMKIIKFPE